jgi:hypothetical protein
VTSTFGVSEDTSGLDGAQPCDYRVAVQTGIPSLKTEATLTTKAMRGWEDPELVSRSLEVNQRNCPGRSRPQIIIWRRGWRWWRRGKPLSRADVWVVQREPEASGTDFWWANTHPSRSSGPHCTQKSPQTHTSPYLSLSKFRNDADIPSPCHQNKPVLHLRTVLSLLNFRSRLMSHDNIS